jgi:hypothetical protein
MKRLPVIPKSDERVQIIPHIRYKRMPAFIKKYLKKKKV